MLIFTSSIFLHISQFLSVFLKIIRTVSYRNELCYDIIGRWSYSVLLSLHSFFARSAAVAIETSSQCYAQSTISYSWIPNLLGLRHRAEWRARVCLLNSRAVDSWAVDQHWSVDRSASINWSALIARRKVNFSVSATRTQASASLPRCRVWSLHIIVMHRTGIRKTTVLSIKLLHTVNQLPLLTSLTRSYV